MRAGSRVHREMVEYTLSDYQFLEDYEVIDSGGSRHSFVAQIKNTAQKVRFIKKRFTEELFPRFTVLAKLYKQGIVLADNMFIITECEHHYFYVIEAELEPTNTRFRSLLHYLHEEVPSEQQRKEMVAQIKILVDCLHQEGQAYGGLDPRSIIVDDENHIYLAPFPLELELKTDNYSRAYYPPELLGKMSRAEGGNCEMEEASMMRWDYWSFGCLTAELLFYSSPLFLHTSLPRQIKRIDQFAFVDELATLEEPMKNVILNSLNRDELARNISTTQATRTKNAESEIDLKKTIKNWRKAQDQVNNDEATELNVFKDSETGDSELAIHFISLEGLSFKEELHCVVHLNKKYHFYIDSKPDATRYKLSKAITIRGSFAELAKLLEEPVKIEAKEGADKTTILVNLQSLVMMHEGRRLWNKQLLGTYKADNESHCPQAKLKLSCLLSSPEFSVEELKAEEPKAAEKQPLATVTEEPKPVLPTPLAEITNTAAVGKKKKEKASSRCDIPSISEISKSISSITEHFMKKLSSKEQPAASDNPLKDKLQSLLEFS